MAGERLEVARLGWHGIEGDRRFAFRRVTDQSDRPWLTASKLPELLLYKPFGPDANSAEVPTHVRTPEGKEFELRSDELRREISRRHGGDVELMNLKQGIFDEACISVISIDTVHSVARESGRGVDLCDLRRFRPNVVIETNSGEPFAENNWVGHTLVFGDGNGGATRTAVIGVTMKDERCVMVNLDPDTAARDSAVMKTVVRLNENYAGVYGTVVEAGELRVGQVVSLESIILPRVCADKR
jgi:uncharacterized protein YcbX